MLGSAARHAGLIRELTARDLAVRYRGTSLGLLWAALTPLVLLGIFTFVFTMIFQPRWVELPEGAGRADFALAIFCGIVVFGAFSEPIARASGLIVGSPSYVKKIVFPLEILPVVNLCSTLVLLGINVSVLIAAILILRGHLPLTAAALPLAVAPAMLLSLGVSWFLASLGVYIRDMGHAVSLALQMLYFLTPVFYPLSAVPEPYRSIAALNPVSAAVEATRSVLLYGVWPDWAGLGAALLAGVIVAQLGYAWFITTKRGFADVV